MSLRRIALASLLALPILSTALISREARAVLVDATATYAFEATPLFPGPYDKITIIVRLGELTTSAGLRLTVYDDLAGPALGSVAASNIIPGAGGVSASFDLNAALPDTDGFVTVEAFGSLDITSLEVGLRTGGLFPTFVFAQLVSPAPEPAALALFGIAIAAFGFSRRRPVARQ
jgi:hypothetical protein